MVRLRTTVAVCLILVGVVAIVGPIFGFSTIAADRGVTVSVAGDQSNALVGIAETDNLPNNQEDAVVVEITNNAADDFETLDTQVTLDDSNGALAISNDFETSLNRSETTGLELTCDGGGSGTATVKVRTDASGSSVQVLGVDFSYTFDYSCTGNGGPVADAGGSYVVYEGNDVELDGTASEGNIRSYSWQIIDGNGTLTDADTAAPTYSAPDDVADDTNVTVELTVTDNKGLTDTDTATITVRDADDVSNLPPVADFIYSRSGGSNNVDLDGSPSTDLDGTINSYKWDVRNDGTIDYTDQTVNKAVIQPGTEVALVVTDDGGKTDSVVKMIE